MTDDSTLRQLVRAAIQAGELPNRLPDRLWGGAATGAPCAICGEPTTDREFEFAYDGPDGSESYFAHPDCWRAFEAEVANLAGPSAFDAGPAARPEVKTGGSAHREAG